MWFICSHTVALHTHHALPRQVSALFCPFPLTSHHRHSTTQTETAVQVPSPSMLVPLLYATSIVGGFFLYCPLPLFFELVVEETYPRISAATSGGVLSILNTLVQVVFLFAPLGRWMVWAIIVATPVFSLPLLVMRARYPRTRLDRQVAISWLDRSGCF